MIRVLIDTNAVDFIVGDDHTFDLVVQAVKDGRLELLTTHVVEDEIENAPAARRAVLRQLPIDIGENTSGFVLDTSRLGRAELGDDTIANLYETVAGHGPAHRSDALLLVTADKAQIPLVTADKRLTRQCLKHGVRCWSPTKLIKRLT